MYAAKKTKQDKTKPNKPHISIKNILYTINSYFKCNL